MPMKTKTIKAYISTWGVIDVNGNETKWRSEDIKANFLSDLILSFATISEKDFCTLDLNEVPDYFDEVQKLKEDYKRLNVCLAIGGGAAGPKSFSKMAKNENLKKKFLQNIKSFLKENLTFSGIDIDWEFPEVSDEKNYIKFLSDLRNCLDSLSAATNIKYQLTTALPVNIAHLYSVLPKIEAYVDSINFMFYDFHSAASNYAGHNSSLYGEVSIKTCLEKILSTGLSSSKITMGLPFYAQKWDLPSDINYNNLFTAPLIPFVNGDDYGVALPVVKRFLATPEYKNFWDEKQGASYLHNEKENIFVSYPSEQFIKEAVNLAREKNITGFMFWEYGQEMSGELLEVLYSSC